MQRHRAGTLATRPTPLVDAILIWYFAKRAVPESKSLGWDLLYGFAKSPDRPGRVIYKMGG